MNLCSDEGLNVAGVLSRLSQISNRWQPIAAIPEDIYKNFQSIQVYYPVLPDALGLVEHALLGLVFHTGVNALIHPSLP
jgi:hypothetical protein